MLAPITEDQEQESQHSWGEDINMGKVQALKK
jgi:hypothetical protein